MGEDYKNESAGLPPPIPGEHFGLGGKNLHSEAAAVYKEAVELTKQQDPSETFYPTARSREVIKKISRNEDLSAEDVLVNRVVIQQARKNIDRFKPEEHRTEK